MKICDQCHREYVPGRNKTYQRFCSERCGHKWRYENGSNVYICQQCKQQYTAKGKSRDKFCSRECSQNYLKANGNINLKSRETFGKNHLTRAKKYGVAWERIRTIDILERDGWRCYICGVSTPKELRGTFEDNAPELDHIVPMVAGGGHVKSNVACCCRKCNNDKSGRLGR